MKNSKNKIIIPLISFLILASLAFAGVPLNNLEGVGGVAFNPLAYPAGQYTKETEGGVEAYVAKPQFGAWYVNLNEVKVDWTAISAATSFFHRLELSYGYEVIAPNGKNIRKNNLGAKILLLPEDWNEQTYLPAISVGAIGIRTSSPASDNKDLDYYLVATKLIKQTPLPVLVSAGVRSTKAWVTGVFGFDHDRDEIFFANLDVLPLANLAIGAEFQQGAKFDDFKNANYWDAHAAWFATDKLTLVAAYVNAGNEDSTSKVGLGGGLVLSTQYAF